ncbi:MAG TPA: thiamine pyrophosphate-dependent enzyme [Thermoanaerobaculia bacterium]|nr:thiamine pyrophosphate-dependent enzyme [Thermoanaerobaculia bacterium]
MRGINRSDIVSVDQSEQRATSQFTRESIIRDYRIAYQSRQASTLGRKEVLTGKAKFGIFGDGKEIAQLAMARAFRKGDFRSGYYRDQTFMFATGMSNVEEFFAQLYADSDVERDPNSAGRSMNAHFGSRTLNPDGTFRNLADSFNTASDVSPTGSQMPRLVGLAYASKLYRKLESLNGLTQFSHNGDEIAFGTIGNASCAEGMFWEAVNAVGVLQSPMLLSIWDDGYGISVPNEFQMCKGNISDVLSGFQRGSDERLGYDIYTVKGWDYPALCETYVNAASIVRAEHVPAIIHVVDVTQPSGHSTSGSHERYKSVERMRFEEEFDGLRKMRDWIVEQSIATEAQLSGLEEEERVVVRDAQRKAWNAYRAPIDAEVGRAVSMIRAVSEQSERRGQLEAIATDLSCQQAPFRRDSVRAAVSALVMTRGEDNSARKALTQWREAQEEENTTRYGSELYSSSDRAALKVSAVEAQFSSSSPSMNGSEVLNAFFDSAMKRYPNLIALGEDVGKLGDVNQGFAGLQEKYGELRVSDTGIRECTIVGQAIGMAMRGLRPICEIQYLDYILYALQIMSDDLATLRWRTRGGQKSPVIIRTRGHRLEGIWHAGSPMAGIINLVRGMYVCVPRNMTQAAGFYNTLLHGDDPAIVVEVLNGYRSKEKRPDNLGEFTVPLGVPEVLRQGNDLTIVTYGACCRIALDAAELLAQTGINVEVIDVQTLLPFDVKGVIGESIRKTSRVLFLDEDVPGGASAFMMQQVVEGQKAYEWLDSEPRTLSAKAHRTAYGSDGDYWSKPNRETVFDAVYGIIHESDPGRFPAV